MYYVYILANQSNSVIYVGVTNNLLRRIHEHKNSADPTSFTFRYRVNKLVYFDVTSDVYAAISREKQIKKWNRNRKNQLIQEANPEWKDLYPQLLG